MHDAKASLEAQNRERYGISGAGFDLSNLDETSEDEIQAHLHLEVLAEALAE